MDMKSAVRGSAATVGKLGSMKNSRSPIRKDRSTGKRQTKKSAAAERIGGSAKLSMGTVPRSR